ncbi:MAG: hypothetical protein AB8G11_25105 [Saprospiraceae bacterium]
MRTLLLTITALVFMAASCDKNEKQFLQHIEKTTEVQCYVIAEYPTEPSQQAANELYLLDYKIIEQVKLSDAQQTEIKSYFLNTENYTSKVARTCPFIGKYALTFGFEHDVLEMVLSREQCPKALVQGKKEVFSLDLVKKTLTSLLYK